MSGCRTTKEINTHCPLLAAFKQPTKFEPNPHSRGCALEIPQRSLLRHDVRVHRAYFIPETIQEVSLHTEVLVFEIHLAQLLLRIFGFSKERSSSSFQFIQSLLSRPDGLELVSHGMAVGGVL